MSILSSYTQIAMHEHTHDQYDLNCFLPIYLKEDFIIYIYTCQHSSCSLEPIRVMSSLMHFICYINLPFRFQVACKFNNCDFSLISLICGTYIAKSIPVIRDSSSHCYEALLLQSLGMYQSNVVLCYMMHFLPVYYTYWIMHLWN